MKLIDRPLSRSEIDELLRMLDGCRCRICVSEDIEEIVRMLGFANDYLSILAYSRVKEILSRNSDA